MPQFSFRLQTLLKLREQQRDACRSQLQQAEEARRLLEEQAQALAQQIEDSGQQATSAASPGAIDVDSLVKHRRYGMVLQAQLQQLAQQGELVQEEAERRRGELTEADRQVKVLEKLKERRAADHRRREHYADIKQLDEIAQRTTIRNQHTT